MSVLQSAPSELGAPMPAFELRDFNGTLFRSTEFREYVMVVMFWCNHCPYVKHVADTVVNLAGELQHNDVTFVAINSNSPDREPLDSPEEMAKESAARHYTFPYLVDASQEVARTFGAVCTPDFYVYDRNRTLTYRGQLDDSRPGNGKPLTGLDLRNACESARLGTRPAVQYPSVGCSIKWVK